MSKVCVADVNGSKSLVFMCPACGEHHHAPIGRWTWNQDHRRPSIWPSVVVETKQGERTKRCHCVVRDGQIRYLNDCTHEQAGKTVKMPDQEWGREAPAEMPE